MNSTSSEPVGADHIDFPSTGPLRWDGVHGFWAMRVIPGLESATTDTFSRNVPGGSVELSAVDDSTLRATIRPVRSTSGGEGRAGAEAVDAAPVLSTIRRAADLDTDLAPIEAHLRSDPVLAERLSTAPLGRLPGPFDSFEVAIRAIIGQQISVAGARTLLGRLLVEARDLEAGDRFGESQAASGEPPRFDRFPPPETVAECPIDIGMPRSRRETVRTLARAVADGSIDLSPTGDREATLDAIGAVRGIGPWTVGYLAMRCFADPDGWPTGDLALARSLDVPIADLPSMAERWRPWRAYAALLIWATDPTTGP